MFYSLSFLLYFGSDFKNNIQIYFVINFFTDKFRIITKYTGKYNLIVYKHLQ